MQKSNIVILIWDGGSNIYLKTIKLYLLEEQKTITTTNVPGIRLKESNKSVKNTKDCT